MPTYTYTCTACNDLIEKRQSFSDPPLTTCEQCGGTLRKVIHPVGIVFKGSGWYITDSRSSSSASANGRAGSSSGEGDSSSKSEKSEKSETSSTTAKDSSSTSKSTSTPASTSSSTSSSKSED